MRAKLGELQRPDTSSAERPEEQHEAEQETGVTDAVDDEGLLPRIGVLVLLVPDADQPPERADRNRKRDPHHRRTDDRCCAAPEAWRDERVEGHAEERKQYDPAQRRVGHHLRELNWSALTVIRFRNDARMIARPT